MDPFTMMALGGMALGAIQGERKAEQQRKWNAAQAEVTRYSPWTGIKGDIRPVDGDWMSGAMQGGMTGAMMGQQFGGGAKPTPQQPSQMSALGQSNAPMFEAGRYDQMGGVMDATNLREPAFTNFNRYQVKG